ncbi:DUF1704 domain-containing protein [Flavobacteriaceae bacterium TK19130]|nr:DUF1704 domain-containing protein [Thermobacterium salinum]
MEVSTEENIQSKKIDKILRDLEPGGRTVCPLPHDGHLFLEHDVPSLFIYRKKENDTGTLRLARTGASYLIIGESDFSFFQALLHEITERMADRFGSYILVELYSGEEDSTEFVIKGPAHKLPVSLDVLKESLATIESRKFGVELSARIEQTKTRQQPESTELFTIESLRELGGTQIGLEVPPVYRNGNGDIYPVYFRKFREQFADSLQRAIFEFIRVQTSSPLAHFNALGKREIHKEVFKIDRQMAEIQSSYQFLLLLAPVNIQQLREKFFESDFKTIDYYHYRLLPVDPDILKRRLYNLRIDEIDDPALSYIFDEKREEIDHQLTMLKERGSENFFYSSIRLYKGLEKKVLSEAELILQAIDHQEPDERDDMIDVHEFAAMARKEFEFFKERDSNFTSKVHIRDDVNIMMVSNGELYLPGDYTLSRKEAKALIQHEVGTHALTYYNGRQQPLHQMAIGLADYDALQEGIAVLSEYLIGGLSGNRLRTLAGRVVAGHALLEGQNFTEVFHMLYSRYGFSKEYAFNITSRMFQGGGFIKDIIYLKGLVHLREYLIEGGELEPLLAGKFALKHLDVIKNLTDRELLIPPKLKPRYLFEDDYEEKMKKITQGLALSKMI